jgi:hypothetical protein
VTGAVGQRGGRLDDAVTVGPQPRELGRELPRDTFDAADLEPRRGARVDDDRPVLVGSSAFGQSERG